MTSEWMEVSVGDVTIQVTKGTTPTTIGFGFENEGVRFIKVESLSEDGRFLEGKFAYISDESHNSLLRSQLQEDDVLFTIAGTIGRTAIVDAKYLPANTNQAVAIIRPDKAKVSPRFLRYVLSNRAFTVSAKSKTVQSVQANYSLGELKKARFYLPTLKGQSEILSVLSPIDDRITLLRETNSTLEAIAQALFKSWFVDFSPVRAKAEGKLPEGIDEATAALFPDAFEETELGMVPEGWTVKTLGDITERITKGTTPTTLKRPFVTSGINFVKAESMTGDGGFIPNKFAFIDEETHQLLNRSQLKAGDILISIAGTIGRIAVMTDEFLPANTNQAVAILRPISKIFPSELINRYLRLEATQRAMNEKVVQAVQANLSLGTLSSLKLSIPPEGDVEKLFNSGFAQIEKSWAANEQRVMTLTDLRDTLLPRLISGQLRIADAEAELEKAVA